MAKTNKKSKDYKYGLTGTKKKLGINFWRFFFNGLDTVSGAEQMFFVELELVNPWLSPSEVILGFKPRVNVTAEDLQYALAGTTAAKNINTETIVQPSYCVIRAGMLGSNAKQLCYYFPIKDAKIASKPFEFVIGNKSFSENRFTGFLSISEEDKNGHPEYLCDSGYASWDLYYEDEKYYTEGYKNKTLRWFPNGLAAKITGKISFDGNDYLVDPRKCNGYMDRMWGLQIQEPWFHLSSATLTSVITGKTLQNSAFVVQGIFDGKVSFAVKLEDSEIILSGNKSNRQFSVIWDCTQMPETEDIHENQLHWSVSINHKLWIIDIDVYCKIQELFNRSFELPEGSRKVLNMLEGGTGYGEMKIYRRVGNTLEQIEHTKLVKVVCEYGHSEEGEF